MKRREAKFVHASPRLAPDQITAAPHLRETRGRRNARVGLQRTQTVAAPNPVRRGKSLVK
jgi:hypothetical protein